MPEGCDLVLRADGDQVVAEKNLVLRRVRGVVTRGRQSPAHGVHTHLVRGENDRMVDACDVDALGHVAAEIVWWAVCGVVRRDAVTPNSITCEKILQPSVDWIVFEFVTYENKSWLAPQER